MVRKLADKFGGKYLKAAHFPKPKKLVVSRMTDDKMPDGDEKTVAWFQDEERGLVLNKTNAESLCEIASTDDLDECVDFAAVLYAAKTDFGGRSVDCIRIRAPKDGSNAAGETSDEIPF